MAKTKRQTAQEKEHEMVAYFKTLGKEQGAPLETLSARLGISRSTLCRKYASPKEFTVAEIDKICQILQPSEEYELRLRGFKV